MGFLALFSLPFSLKQNKYLFSQPRHLTVLFPAFSTQFPPCTTLLKIEHSRQTHVCVFQIPGLFRSCAWDTNGTRSSDFFVGIIFIVQTFSFKLEMSLELSPVHLLSLENCPFFANIACEGNCTFSSCQVLLQVSVTNVQINPLPCKQGFYRVERWQKKGGYLGLFQLFNGHNHKTGANLRILVGAHVGVTSQLHSTGTRAKCCNVLYYVTCIFLRIKKIFEFKFSCVGFLGYQQFSRFSYLPTISHLFKGKICRGKICQC